jgi:hypothetical protein
MTHGTRYAYRKGCRCDACVGWSRERERKRREKNPEAIREYQRKWNAAHPRYSAEKAAEWRVRNKDYLRVLNRRRQVAFYANLRLLKATQGCCLCGRKDGVLAHHHVDPATKLYAVTQMYRLSLDAFIDEIGKCVVLCDSCHGRWHAEWRSIYG